MVWAPLRRRVRALFAREGVPVTPQQREYIAQVLLFPVRRARDDSAVLAAHLYNGEAARHGVDPIGKPQVQFYPRGALESVLERAAAPKVTVEGLDKLGAHPARVRVDGLDGLDGSVAGVRIEGLDDFGTALEHARVDIDESNRRDPQVVEQVVRRTERAVVRHVEQAARDTIKTAVENEQDRRNKMLGRDRERAKVEKAVGWARVLTGLESCGFCAMLASRGPVYGTEWLAQHRGRNQQENKYHDGCDCLLVPVFDLDDWVGRDAYDELEQLWIESDGRKDFEKRFRQIRKDGDVEKYVGAVDPGTGRSSGEESPRPATATGGGGGDDGGHDRPGAGFGDPGDDEGWHGHTRGYVHPHGLPVWSEEERVRRQETLDVELHGEQLYQHEIETVERLKALGESVEWIPRKFGVPTNDFIWNGVEVDTKATRAKYSTIANHLRRSADQARDARSRGMEMWKDNFLVDLGNRALSQKLRHQLAEFNRRNPNNRISRLWVLSQGDLIEVPLNAVDVNRPVD